MKRLEPLFLFLLVNLFALSLLNAPGTYDVKVWMGWLPTLETQGIVKGLAMIYDYPPMSMAVLYAVAKLARGLGVEGFVVYKAGLYLALLLTSALFWGIVRDLVVVALTELTLVLGSTGLGYQDMFYGPPLILSLWALKEKRWILFSLSFAAAFLYKWQPLIIAPFIGVYVLGIANAREWRQIDFKSVTLGIVLPLGAIWVAMMVLFGAPFLQSFERAFTQSYLSGGALNFNWVLTHLLHVFSPQAFGALTEGGEATIIQTTDPRIVLAPKLAFLVLYVIALAAFFRRPKTFENLLLFSLAGYLAYFIFNTGVHENHLFVACLLAALLYCENKSHLLTFLLWALVANINLVLFFDLDGTELSFSRAAGVDLALLLSIFNVVLFAAYYWSVLRRAVSGFKLQVSG
jgi:hypothetical protein